MSLDSAFVVAIWVVAIVSSVAAGAVGLFWSTAALERWLNNVESGDSRSTLAVGENELPTGASRAA